MLKASFVVAASSIKVIPDVVILKDVVLSWSSDGNGAVVSIELAAAVDESFLFMEVLICNFVATASDAGAYGVRAAVESTFAGV